MKRLFIIKRFLVLYLFLIVTLGTSSYAQQFAPFLAIGDDVDATAFLQQAAITDPVQQTAVKRLVQDLKVYGLWTKMQAIYPMVGGTASSHKWNLKDPRDLDAAFRLVFSGGWTHSATGALPNGTTGYADTKYNPNTSGLLNDAHLSFYSRTIGASAGDRQEMGSGSVGRFMGILVRYTGDVAYIDIHSNGGSVANSLTDGYFVGTRTTSTTAKAFRNNSNMGIPAVVSTNLANYSLYLGAINVAGVAGRYSTKEFAFASIGTGLTDTEAGNLYTAVQAFQTALSRQIAP